MPQKEDPPVSTQPLTSTPPTPPPDAPARTQVPWYESQRLIAIFQFTTITVLLWLAQSLPANSWEWRKSLAGPLLASIVVMLKDWWSPNIVAPLAAFNKRN